MLPQRSALINWNQATDRHTSCLGSRAGAPVCQRANPTVAVVRYWWCRAVGFICAAVGCVCAVGLSCAVCVLAIRLKVWLQDDTYIIRDRLPTYAKRSMTNEVTQLSTCIPCVPLKLTIRIPPFNAQWRRQYMAKYITLHAVFGNTYLFRIISDVRT